MSYTPQGGRYQVDFNLVASGEITEYQRVEQKICEDCGRPFCRPAAAVQKGAVVRTCPRCLAQEARRLELEAQRHDAALKLGIPSRGVRRH
jgi:hypothetical protein